MSGTAGMKKSQAKRLEKAAQDLVDVLLVSKKKGIGMAGLKKDGLKLLTEAEHCYKIMKELHDKADIQRKDIYACVTNSGLYRTMATQISGVINSELSQLSEQYYTVLSNNMPTLLAEEGNATKMKGECLSSCRMSDESVLSSLTKEFQHHIAVAIGKCMLTAETKISGTVVDSMVEKLSSHARKVEEASLAAKSKEVEDTIRQDKDSEHEQLDESLQQRRHTFNTRQSSSEPIAASRSSSTSSVSKPKPAVAAKPKGRLTKSNSDRSSSSGSITHASSTSLIKRSPELGARSPSPEHKKISPEPERESPEQNRSPKPEHEKAGSPEPLLAKSPELEKAKSSEPLMAKSPEPLKTKSPEPLKTKSPEPEKAESPEPEKAESPEPLGSKSPEPLESKLHTPLESPESIEEDKGTLSASLTDVVPEEKFENTEKNVTEEERTLSISRSPPMSPEETRKPSVGDKPVVAKKPLTRVSTEVDKKGDEENEELEEEEKKEECDKVAEVKFEEKENVKEDEEDVLDGLIPSQEEEKKEDEFVDLGGLAAPTQQLNSITKGRVRPKKKRPMKSVKTDIETVDPFEAAGGKEHANGDCTPSPKPSPQRFGGVPMMPMGPGFLGELGSRIGRNSSVGERTVSPPATQPEEPAAVEPAPSPRRFQPPRGGMMGMPAVNMSELQSKLNSRRKE